MNTVKLIFIILLKAKMLLVKIIYLNKRLPIFDKEIQKCGVLKYLSLGAQIRKPWGKQ